MNGWLLAEAVFAWGNEMDRALVSPFPLPTIARAVLYKRLTLFVFLVCFATLRPAFRQALLPLAASGRNASLSLPTACLFLPLVSPSIQALLRRNDHC